MDEELEFGSNAIGLVRGAVDLAITNKTQAEKVRIFSGMFAHLLGWCDGQTNETATDTIVRITLHNIRSRTATPTGPLQ